jgi:predicted Zn-dependent protease
VQESTADQIAAKLLLATHQSPMGMYRTFQRFAQEEAMSAYKIDKFAVDHPSGQDRVFDLNDAGGVLALSRSAGLAGDAAHLTDGARQAGRLQSAGEGGADPLS